MAELGKIEKQPISNFSSKRKLYVIPTLPFEELALGYKLDAAKIERFWGEVREKINYFVSTYGKISTIFIEGVNEDDKTGLEFLEKSGKESNHYKLLKGLMDNGAIIRGIEKRTYFETSRLLFDEYQKSFLPEEKEIHEGFYGKDKDFDEWRNYIVKKIQETQDEMGKLVSRLLGELAEETNGILIITDGRPIEFPEGVDVFQIRPPAFDEIARNIREKTK